MQLKKLTRKLLQASRMSLLTIAMLQFSVAGPLAGTAQADEKGKAKSPIKHVIVIVGEDRSFDHIFATYQPKAGESVNNLLSEGIINKDGSPGKHFSNAD
jgi:phospholipase C